MTDDLEELLAKADADAPAPLVRKDLASAVRQAVKRRKRNRRLTVGAIVLIVVGGIDLAIMMPRKPPTTHTVTVARIDVETYGKDLASLDAEANFHARIAAKIEQAVEREKQLQSAKEVLFRSEIANDLDDRREATARLMLKHAEQLDLDPLQREAARENYRKVLAMFPNTVAGGEASDRLHAGT